MKHWLLGLLLLSAFACSAAEQQSWPTNRFQAAEWKLTPEGERYRFARDIVQSKILIGKSESEVRSMLGEPSSENKAAGRLAYVVKIGGSGFDQVFALDVQLNPNDKTVTSVAIRGD